MSQKRSLSVPTGAEHWALSISQYNEGENKAVLRPKQHRGEDNSTLIFVTLYYMQ